MEKKQLNTYTFIDYWLELETNNMYEEDKEQYINELSDALNFKDIFQVIALWSTIPYKERIKGFLQKNNFILDDENMKLLD